MSLATGRLAVRKAITKRGDEPFFHDATPTGQGAGIVLVGEVGMGQAAGIVVVGNGSYLLFDFPS
jgi:hypothetical protein